MSQRQWGDMGILAHICEQRRLSLQSYGRPRMAEERQELLVKVGHQRVGRLMGENGTKIIKTQKYQPTTDSDHRFNTAPNLLETDFSAEIWRSAYWIWQWHCDNHPKGAFTIPIVGRNIVPTSTRSTCPSMA